MEPVLIVNGIKKSYGSKVALENIDFRMNQGEVIGLIGANGAGKSTLINILVGLVKQDQGDFSFTFPDFVAKQDLGVMCQEVSMPKKLKVKEWLKMASLYYKFPYALNDVMEISGIKDFQDKYAESLSGGQKRRVQFALAIIGRPKMLFLDEPTVGMDIEMRMSFWKQLQKMITEGITVFLSSHDLSEIETIVDRIIMIDTGKIMLDEKMEIIKQNSSVVIQILLNTINESQKIAIYNFTQEFKVTQSKKDVLKITPPNVEGTISRLIELGLTYENFSVQKEGLEDLIRAKMMNKKKVGSL